MLAPVILIADSAEQLRASRRYLKQPLPQHLALSARGIPGVDYRDGQLFFDRQIHTEETAQLLIGHLKGECLRATFQGAGKRVQVTQDDLRIINDRHSSEELSAEDVEVFEDYALNDVLSTRRPIKFTKAYLDAAAPLFEEGRTVLLHHNDHRPVGATFAAKVEKATVRGVEANWLIVRHYAVTKGASEQRLQDIRDMKTGVLRYTSIEARGGVWDFQEVEGPDDSSVYFYEVDAGPGLEVGELSRVYLGAIPGAGDSKFRDEASTTESDSTPTKKEREIICVM